MTSARRSYAPSRGRLIGPGQDKEALKTQQTSARTVHDQVAQQLKQLAIREENLLDLAGDGTLSREQIRTRMNHITRERLKLTARLETAERDLGGVLGYLDAAVELLTKPGELYRRFDDEQRQEINQALFENSS